MLTRTHDVHLHERDFTNMFNADAPALPAEYLPYPPLQDVAAEMRRISEEQPDFVYDSGNGCDYQPTPGNPCGCIVGLAIRRLAAAAPRTYRNADGVNGVVSKLYPASIPTQLGLWTSTVQSVQDRNNSWSDAVAEADRSHPA